MNYKNLTKLLILAFLFAPSFAVAQKIKTNTTPVISYDKGTDDKPVVVKILPNKKTQNEIDDEEQDKMEKNIREKNALGLQTQQTDVSIRQYIATIVQAVIFLLQLIAFIFQAWFMRQTVRQMKIATSDSQKALAQSALDNQRALEVAQQSADAASLNAKALVQEKLPILRVSPTDLTYQAKLVDDDTFPGGSVITSVPSKFSCTGHMYIHNYGPTSAFPTSIQSGWIVTDKLPQNPLYTKDTQIKHSAVIRPNKDDDDFSYQPKFYRGIELTEDEISKIKSGDAELWFYGCINYRDFLNIERKARFCWRWSGGSKRIRYEFTSEGNPPETYTRNE